ncbi:hypothetical protein LC605_30115 [Nostoc sp. CHAB 5836]|uniref:hypothetical protein n=1 Tax=Nostoc sp. CHAB 5836 TaxID=2780404 RepID=UPI001E2CEE55|nr:hypothetical protein [Nostoc sp. CHAB 5836]MCC5619253.1 hypothetical protein [Nostoc sp. CHAB 5836]
MQLFSLNQLFGQGAFQDTNILVIQKASLLKLTPHVTNKASALLAAILITALENFQGIIVDSNNQPITDSDNQPITYDNSEAFECLQMIGWKPFRFFRNNQPFINHQIIFTGYAPN